ncbi:MAG TPA: hypothetical protein VK866_09805 [Acidimicrobiales bacterium]|nr:hypothetical protein [Acidimicrobiales bacterium]
MRSARFVLTELVVDGASLPLRGGSLVVARTDPGTGEAGPLDWEVVAATRLVRKLPKAPVRVEVSTREGRSMGGPALVVRSDGAAHVLRGGGDLDGFTSDELGPPTPHEPRPGGPDDGPRPPG